MYKLKSKQKMILTGTKITKEVKKGNIILDPFDEKLVNPNSYNYRLGDYLLEINNEIIDPLGKLETSEIKIPESGFVLQKNKLYLGVTQEKIGSDKYVPSLIGRSSLGRLGLFLQITADLGHIGTKHSWTLELTVIQPLRVYAGMKIGQVSFWKPEGLELLNGEKYINKCQSYSNYSKPQVSIFGKLLN